MKIKQGTSLWAIQQLLDGKKVRYKPWRECDFLHIQDGVIVTNKGLLNSIESIASCCDTAWQLWTPPNPHTKGTFAWAWEEITRGNRVKIYEPSCHEETVFFFFMQEKNLVCDRANTLPVRSESETIPVKLIQSNKWELDD